MTIAPVVQGLMQSGKAHEAAGILNSECTNGGMFMGDAGGSLSFVRGEETMNINMDSRGQLSSVVASNGPGKGMAVMGGQNLERMQRGLGNFLEGVAKMPEAAPDGTLAEDVGVVAQMQAGVELEQSGAPAPARQVRMGMKNG